MPQSQNVNWTAYRLLLVLIMLISGSINTLSAKWADRSSAKGVYPHLPKRTFDHPFLQAVGMFVGELSCLFVFIAVYFYQKRHGTPREIPRFGPYIFIPPAMCDMLATSTMYVGLNLTNASSFQMLRGSVMIFTGLLSVAFIGRKIRSYMWFGMFMVLCGLVVVGLSDVLFKSTGKKDDTNSIITGDLLICAGQIITATQMVYEEKFVNKYDVPPLLAVGFEGLFGFIILGLLQFPFYFIRFNPGNNPITSDPDGRLENALDAFAMMGQNWRILLAILLNMASIAAFNFAGISVTKELSATTRMVIDSLRTVVIWAFSMAVLWEPFKWRGFLLQLFGFFLLLTGMTFYNNLLYVPFLRRKLGCRIDDEDSNTPLIVETNDDEATRLLASNNDSLRQYGADNRSDELYS